MINQIGHFYILGLLGVNRMFQCKWKQTYLASIEAKTISFKNLVAKDASAARIIEQRMRKLIKLHETLAYWRIRFVTDGYMRFLGNFQLGLNFMHMHIIHPNYMYILDCMRNEQAGHILTSDYGHEVH